MRRPDESQVTYYPATNKHMAQTLGLKNMAVDLS